MNPREVLKSCLAVTLPRMTYSYINAIVAARDIVSEKRYEPEIQLLQSFIAAGDCVLDIGGNHGLYAYHLSRLVGPTGIVHSFEPIPFNYEILAHVSQRLRLTNVITHDYACGDRCDEVYFTLPEKNGVPLSGWAHLSAVEETRTHRCRMATIDSLTFDRRISFIKCDVEGAEMFVFKGAEKSIATDRPVILCEIEHGHTARYGLTAAKVVSHIASLGYSVHALYLGALKRIDLLDLNGGNYFFLPV